MDYHFLPFLDPYKTPTLAELTTIYNLLGNDPISLSDKAKIALSMRTIIKLQGGSCLQTLPNPIAFTRL